MKGLLNLKGRFECVHRDKDGREKARLVVNNLIVDQGMNYLLATAFPGVSSQMVNWAALFVDASGFVAFDPTDTASSHAGWTEFSSFTPSATFSWGVESGRQITATGAQVTFSGAATLKGFAIIFQASTGGGNQLWAEGFFLTGDQLVAPSDTMTVTYQISG